MACGIKPAIRQSGLPQSASALHASNGIPVRRSRRALVKTLPTLPYPPPPEPRGLVVPGGPGAGGLAPAGPAGLLPVGWTGVRDEGVDGVEGEWRCRPGRRRSAGPAPTRGAARACCCPPSRRGQAGAALPSSSPLPSPAAVKQAASQPSQRAAAAAGSLPGASEPSERRPRAAPRAVPADVGRVRHREDRAVEVGVLVVVVDRDPVPTSAVRVRCASDMACTLPVYTRAEGAMRTALTVAALVVALAPAPSSLALPVAEPADAGLHHHHHHHHHPVDMDQWRERAPGWCLSREDSETSMTI